MPGVRGHGEAGGLAAAGRAALWRIALVRLSTEQTTRDYLARRVSEGKTKPEAIRYLKRYIAREMFNALPKPTLVGLGASLIGGEHNRHALLRAGGSRPPLRVSRRYRSDTQHSVCRLRPSAPSRWRAGERP